MRSHCSLCLINERGVLHPLISGILGHGSEEFPSTARHYTWFCSLYGCLPTHKRAHTCKHLASFKQSAKTHLYLTAHCVSCCRARCSYNAVILPLSTEHTVIVMMPRVNEMPPYISALLSQMLVIIVCSFFSDWFLIFVQVVGVTAIPTMVQKYQSPVRVYKHPFELVMAVSVFTCVRSQRSVHMNIACHRCRVM